MTFDSFADVSGYILLFAYVAITTWKINKSALVALVAFCLTFGFEISDYFYSLPAWVAHFIIAMPYVSAPFILKFNVKVSILMLGLGVANWLYTFYHLTPYVLPYDGVAFFILSFAVHLGILFTMYKAKDDGRVRHTGTGINGDNDIWRIPAFAKENPRGTNLL